MESIKKLESNQLNYLSEASWIPRGFACLPIVGTLDIFYEFSLLYEAFEKDSHPKRRIQVLHLLNQYLICDVIRDGLTLVTLASIEVLGQSAEFTPPIKIGLYTLAAAVNLFRLRAMALNNKEIHSSTNKNN